MVLSKNFLISSIKNILQYSIKKKNELGQVVIDLKSLEEGKPTEKWYSIIPVKSDAESNLGTMRIKTTMIVIFFLKLITFFSNKTKKFNLISI